jgi:hypothetical protein
MKMNRGKNIRSILLSIIAASIILTPIIYVQANKRIYANRVTRYLVEEKHYRKDEIQSVKGVWGKKLPSFYAVAIFKDEPQVEYDYFAHADISQFGFRAVGAVTGVELQQKDVKHYEPR